MAWIIYNLLTINNLQQSSRFVLNGFLKYHAKFTKSKSHLHENARSQGTIRIHSHAGSSFHYNSLFLGRLRKMLSVYSTFSMDAYFAL